MPSCISVSSLRARRRKQRDIKRAATAPSTAPGKKPTAIASAGKAGHEAAHSADVVELLDFSDDGDGTGVIVACEAVVLVAVVDDDTVGVGEPDILDIVVVEDFFSREQVLLPWQV